MERDSRPRLETDVLVVGAGPTGLTLANLLGGFGVATILVERNASTVDEPRAVSIDDESMRAMQAIGLADAVLAATTRAYGSRYISPGGSVFAKVDPLSREYGFDKRNAFEQPVLENLLRQGLGRYGHVAQLFDQELVSFEQDEARVTAKLGSGMSVSAKLMVACDGGRSFVRKSLGVEMVGSTFTERWLIVDLVKTSNRFRHTEVFCNPGRPCISLPGPRGIRRYEFMLHKDEADQDATSEPFVRRLLAEVGPDREAPLRRVRVYTFHARIAETWRRGRVFLAGDAAHLSPPFAGQGMNSGIRDAHNLAWKLAAALASARECNELLDSYQLERKPHAWQMIGLALRMGKVMMPSSRLQAFLLRLGFRILSVYPPARDYVAQMRYKPKPRFDRGMLWPDGRGGDHMLVGRLFPQPIVESEHHQRHRLDDVLGSGSALIVFSERPDSVVGADMAADFERLGIRVIGLTPEYMNAVSAAFPVYRDVSRFTSAKAFRAYTDQAFLLRPDRYVAATAALSDLGAILEHAAKIAIGDTPSRSIGAGSATVPEGDALENKEGHHVST
ncbi:bifunctional 3-(3-hydroxy-phenyl)propionate/3-hydroxycinnamic acid hydroxylase [Mesorhizobium koreense]|uniref:bifunctional 3-(3-hydroxy-phenyl)propionate/3-hydroxycinnamic acid hydroxylase n=1 Tax=Mesorhizobium koreense TaxID=3074855 RepID=UPI00287B8670|nr:bifunctional 3-(3-hydroxy-phenyl)propionate/3-hydroxycinnamic acid hydroxylase [Mesorhizobium sp. WR6]